MSMWAGVAVGSCLKKESHLKCFEHCFTFIFILVLSVHFYLKTKQSKLLCDCSVDTPGSLYQFSSGRSSEALQKLHIAYNSMIISTVLCYSGMIDEIASHKSEVSQEHLQSPTVHLACTAASEMTAIFNERNPSKKDSTEQAALELT